MLLGLTDHVSGQGRGDVPLVADLADHAAVLRPHPELTVAAAVLEAVGGDLIDRQDQGHG